MIDGMTAYVLKEVALTKLFDYYQPAEVEGYCRACPNYGNIWSCPPYETDVIKSVKAYDRALIIGVETFDFHASKRAIALAMNQIAERLPVYVLIAGNCEICDTCSKGAGMPCVYPEQMKYSLESIGFHVSDICEHILGKSLKWDEENPVYLAVAAVLYRTDDANVRFSATLNQLLEGYGWHRPSE